MKQFIPQEQHSKTVSNIIVVAFGAAMLALLIYFQQVWNIISTVFSVTMPFLIGFGLAFIQLPVVHRTEWLFNKLIFRKKKHPKLTRALSTVISLLLVLAIVAAFLSILLPQVIDSVQSLITNVVTYVRENIHILSQWMATNEFLPFTIEENEVILSIEQFQSQASSYITFFIDNVLAIGSKIYTVVFQLFVCLITSFYLLMDKERFCAQTKKVCYALMKQDSCESLIYWSRRAHKIFAGFISGKILDSAIIGVLCYFGMLLFKIEYPLLISVIVGVTNVIPFFGPFIGAIPSILILLIVNPYSALWFSIFVLVLQQLDGNVIGPLILGDYVGISPLWIMISIVIGGGLFGFAGMLLSVPVFALLYAIVRSMIETRLKRRGLPIPSASYNNAPEKLDKKLDKKNAAN